MEAKKSALKREEKRKAFSTFLRAIIQNTFRAKGRSGDANYATVDRENECRDLFLQSSSGASQSRKFLGPLNDAMSKERKRERRGFLNGAKSKNYQKNHRERKREMTWKKKYNREAILVILNHGAGFRKRERERESSRKS
jgi:hypothetical protein